MKLAIYYVVRMYQERAVRHSGAQEVFWKGRGSETGNAARRVMRAWRSTVSGLSCGSHWVSTSREAGQVGCVFLTDTMDCSQFCRALKNVWSSPCRHTPLPQTAAGFMFGAAPVDKRDTHGSVVYVWSSPCRQETLPLAPWQCGLDHHERLAANSCDVTLLPQWSKNLLPAFCFTQYL